MPIAPVKRGVKAVLLDDMEMLKDAINDTENVYTVCIPWEEFSKEPTSGQENSALFPNRNESFVERFVGNCTFNKSSFNAPGAFLTSVIPEAGFL